MAKEHVPALDGIRGIAILAVLLGHAVTFGTESLFEITRWSRWFYSPLAAGWWGVDLFFVLSGFLITGILIDTREAGNRAWSFYARRFLRIFPLYYLTLVVTLLVAARFPLLNSFIEPHWFDRAAYFVYLQNWAPLWNGGVVRYSVFGHFWSLAVEEQFYFLWPVVVWRCRERTLLWICVAGAAASLLLRVGLVAFLGPHLWLNVLTVTRGEGLLVGSAFAVLAARGRRVPAGVIAGVGGLGMALIGAILILHVHEFVDTNTGPLVYTIGITGLGLLFGALVASSQYHVPVVTRVLTMGWLRSFGKYSYGIYVYHVVIFLMANQVVLPRLGMQFPLSPRASVIYVAGIIGASYGAAWVSYEFFEVRFLRMKRRFEPESGSDGPAGVPSKQSLALSLKP